MGNVAQSSNGNKETRGLLDIDPQTIKCAKAQQFLPTPCYQWFYGVMISTLDSQSSGVILSLSRTFLGHLLCMTVLFPSTTFRWI